MDFIQVCYRPVGQDPESLFPWRFLPMAPQDTGDIVLPALEDGVEYEVRYRRVTRAGRVGAWSYMDRVTPTTAREVAFSMPRELSLSRDGCLSWRFEDPPPALAGFEVLHAAGNVYWVGLAEPAHDGLVQGPPFPLCGIPRGLRTFFVRPVDLNGNRGPAYRLVLDRGDIDELQDVLVSATEEAPAFTGTITGGAISGGKVVADQRTLVRSGYDDRPVRSGDPDTPMRDSRWEDLTYEVDFLAPSVAYADYFLTMSPVVEEVVGGWQLSYLTRWEPIRTGNPGAFVRSDATLQDRRRWRGVPAEAYPRGDDDDLVRVGRLEARVRGAYEFRRFPGSVSGISREKLRLRIFIPAQFGRRPTLAGFRYSWSRPFSVPEIATQAELDAVQTTLQASIDAVPRTGRLIKTTVLDTVGSGTFTPDPLTTRILLEAMGSGGGGGGADSAGVPATAAAAGGGGSGAYLRKNITTVLPSYAYTVPAGGLGGLGLGAGPGGNGADAVFGSGGSAFRAKGGLGAVGAPNTLVDNFSPGGTGQVSTNGDVNGKGAPGTGGQVYGGTTIAKGGHGGSSAWGAGGEESNNGPGIAAAGRGGGGGGGSALGGINAAGGNGSQGSIIVHEFS